MLERIAWSVLGVIHLLPALALFQPSLLTRLYGVGAETTAFTLLHHRAALFVVVFVVCVWAAAVPVVRQLATVAVGISMVSFLLLYVRAGSPPPLRMIALADLAGLPFLLFVAIRAFRPT